MVIYSGFIVDLPIENDDLMGFIGLPSGKRLHNYGKSPLLMGKSTISMAIFNSYVELPKGSPIAPHSIFTSISIIDSVLFYYQQVAVINHELLHRGIPPNAILL